MTKNYKPTMIKFLNLTKKMLTKILSTDCVCKYVATTRPVEQLFLYVQKPTTDKNGNENPSNIEIYDFLKSKNVENLDSFDVFKMDENALKKQSRERRKTTHFSTNFFFNSKARKIC